MADAICTEFALSRQIRAVDGDYLWLAKDNQPNLRHDIADPFAP